jgi:hypothetical protein
VSGIIIEESKFAQAEAETLLGQLTRELAHVRLAERLAPFAQQDTTTPTQ